MALQAAERKGLWMAARPPAGTHGTGTKHGIQGGLVDAEYGPEGFSPIVPQNQGPVASPYHCCLELSIPSRRSPLHPPYPLPKLQLNSALASYRATLASY